MGSIKIKTKLIPKAEQATVLTLALREAVSILEMPLPDLAAWLHEQIEQNPALQFDEGVEAPDNKGSGFKNFSDDTTWTDQIAAPSQNLYSYLMQQAREILHSPDDLNRMEEIIGNLDDKGFLGDFAAGESLLQLLYTFDPPGIGAKNLQHSLLMQLARRGKEQTVAYLLIRDHYDDFLHRRNTLPFSPSELESAIHLLSTLTLDPTAPFRQHTVHPQTPDIFIELQEGSWHIILNDSLLPKYRLSLAPELSRFVHAARWIDKMVARRTEIITSIMKQVLEVQNDFFHGKTSDLHPLSYKQIARKLGLHDSTISRAVKDKVLSSPRGIYPLRFFFPHASSDAISHHTAKERLKQLIGCEDKHNPLTDEALSHALHAQGIPCARRTVAKYRKKLLIPGAPQRKQNPNFSSRP